jgi:flagellar basal body L-ring protein FlgH
MRAQALLLLALVAISGCGKFLGNLRRDLDDSDGYTEPVVGGRWAERGFLAGDMPESGHAPARYSAVGHSERAPASMSSGGEVGQQSWVSRDNMDANRRDRYRGQDYSGDGSEEQSQPTFLSSSNVPPASKRQYRATRADFQDQAQNEGSLWASDGQTNYYFTKNKIRGVGDIVTITMEPEMLKDVKNEFRRSLTFREKELEVNLAQERIRRKAYGLEPLDEDPSEGKKKDQVSTSAAAPQREALTPEQAAKEADRIANLEIPNATVSDINVGPSVEIKPGDTMMAEIVERYPNGNYKIRATKRVSYKNGPPRLLNLVGIARGTDITEDDLINSGKLYEYRLEAIR